MNEGILKNQENKRTWYILKK